MLVVNPSAVLNAAAPLAQEYAVCCVFTIRIRSITWKGRGSCGSRMGDFQGALPARRAMGGRGKHRRRPRRRAAADLKIVVGSQ